LNAKCWVRPDAVAYWGRTFKVCGEYSGPLNLFGRQLLNDDTTGFNTNGFNGKKMWPSIAFLISSPFPWFAGLAGISIFDFSK